MVTLVTLQHWCFQCEANSRELAGHGSLTQQTTHIRELKSRIDELEKRGTLRGGKKSDDTCQHAFSFVVRVLFLVWLVALTMHAQTRQAVTLEADVRQDDPVGARFVDALRRTINARSDYRLTDNAPNGGIVIQIGTLPVIHRSASGSSTEGSAVAVVLTRAENVGPRGRRRLYLIREWILTVDGAVPPDTQAAALFDALRREP